MEFNHISVLKDEVINEMRIKPDGLYLDGTIGGGGHSYEIAKRLTTGKLVGIDRDQDALDFAGNRLSEFKDNIILIKGDFKNMRELLMPYGLFGFDGILLDIGVSSYQIDNKDRGFTFSGESKLDMRMDESQDLSAYEVVNEYDLDRLTEIFFKYGEERYSRRIARKIVEEREKAPIVLNSDLVELIKISIPYEAKKSEIKIIARIFQAIRIEVNDELESLKKVIPDALSLLKKGGRLEIISFHSLEDRIVKEAFNYAAKDCICDPKAPICTCDKVKEGRVITKKPIIPSKEEIRNNSRSRSAKLRVIERV